MKIKSMSQASIEYQALIYLYDEAVKESEDPSDEIELAFETLDNFIERAKKEHELLGLYQEREKSRVTVDGFLKGWELTKQIKALEEELE